MPKFLLVVGGADVDKRGTDPEFASVLLDRYLQWVRQIHSKNAFVSSHRLNDQVGRRLTIRGGEVIDGPFIESKDAIGGIIIVETESLDEATEFARACPVLDMQNGFVEVRAIEASRPASDPSLARDLAAAR
jgi:hypothetical protein